ncbi:MAG TPA: hypothetical protein VMC79_15235, partial [Rectinemataceae bacterium]|nr:hypothetical protein [Rectinemataceae bacterium]
YLAVVHGHFPAEIRACGRLLQDEGSAVRKKRRFVAGIESDCRPSDSSGESCDTLFSLRASCSSDSGPMSLVLARPRTGRTHQIRASLSSLGFPLVGDKLYGLDEGMFLRFAGGRLSDIDRSRLVLEHQALHCSALRFTEIGGAEVALESEPPWEFCDGPGVRFRPPGPPAALPLRSGAEPRSRPVCTP